MASARVESEKITSLFPEFYTLFLFFPLADLQQARAASAAEAEAVTAPPLVGTALTWPKTARVSLQGAGAPGRLLKFPARDAGGGGPFASLKVACGPFAPDRLPACLPECRT